MFDCIVFAAVLNPKSYDGEVFDGRPVGEGTVWLGRRAGEARRGGVFALYIYIPMISRGGAEEEEGSSRFI